MSECWNAVTSNGFASGTCLQDFKCLWWEKTKTVGSVDSEVHVKCCYQGDKINITDMHESIVMMWGQFTLLTWTLFLIIRSNTQIHFQKSITKHNRIFSVGFKNCTVNILCPHLWVVLAMTQGIREKSQVCNISSAAPFLLSAVIINYNQSLYQASSSTLPFALRLRWLSMFSAQTEAHTVHAHMTFAGTSKHFL